MSVILCFRCRPGHGSCVLSGIIVRRQGQGLIWRSGEDGWLPRGLRDSVGFVLGRFRSHIIFTLVTIFVECKDWFNYLTIPYCFYSSNFLYFSTLKLIDYYFIESRTSL